MTLRWTNLLHLLQLTRIALVFAAISNSWLVIFLTRRVEPASTRNPGLNDWPLALTLLLGAVIAAGLHAYGMALNDVMDARHDRLFSPQRPIAAGRLGARPAVIVAVVGLLAALAAAVFFGQGSTLLCVVVATAILFYDVTGKFLPSVGIVSLGLIRAMHMFIPNPTLGFAWPIWLMMTHVMICTAVAYRLESKRPHLHGGEWWGLAAGWAFWTLALLAWMLWQETIVLDTHRGIWVGPGAAIVLFIAAAWYTLHGHRRPLKARRAAGHTFLNLSVLWLIVYDASWLLAAGLWWPGAILLVLFAIACGTIWLLTMLTDLSEPAPRYHVGPAARRAGLDAGA